MNLTHTVTIRRSWRRRAPSTTSGESQRSPTRLDHLVTEGRSENNFDLLRLIAALMVLFGHSFDLTGTPEPLNQLNEVGWGSVGVLIFFSISGFLVARSWDFDRHIGAFAAKRALRLLPGLIVALLLSALVLGPIVTTLPLGSYLSDPTTKNYILGNATLQSDFTLPGVFAHTIYPVAVNGSLWTLPVEAKAYLLLAAFGVLGLLVRVRAAMLILSVYAALAMFPGIRQSLPLGAHYAAYLVDIQMPAGTVAQVSTTPSVFIPYLDFLAAFGIGAGMYQLRRWIPILWSMSAAFFIAIVLTVIIAGRFALAGSEVMVLVLPYLVLCIAYRSRRWVRLPSWWGDYSYGIYIYAFVVQQALSHWLSLRSGWVMFVLATPITLALAACSWHFVERRALSLKRAFGGSTAEAHAPLS